MNRKIQMKITNRKIRNENENFHYTMPCVAFLSKWPSLNWNDLGFPKFCEDPHNGGFGDTNGFGQGGFGNQSSGGGGFRQNDVSEKIGKIFYKPNFQNRPRNGGGQKRGGNYAGNNNWYRIVHEEFFLGGKFFENHRIIEKFFRKS